MATQEELRQLMNEAHAAGDMEAVEQLSEMVDNYRLEGYTPQVMQDVQSIASDAMTRGFGTANNPNTQAARERQPGWIEAPADIFGSVVGAPYKVGSKLAGMAWGAGEGALSEYGHQENWIPGTEEWKDIGTAGVEGAGLGWLGAKVGEYFGGGKAMKDTKADQVYPDDAALRTAADEADRVAPGGPRATDLDDRVARLEELRGAQTKGRDAFANLRAGSPEEAAEFAKIAEGRKGMSPFLADQVERLSLAKGKGIDLTDVPRLARMGLDLKTTGGVGMISSTAADLLGIPARMRSVPARETERAAALIRDPRGIGLAPDQATINAWRDKLSKAAAGYGREP